MKKKSYFWKNVRRTISHSKGRFFSIFLIVFLGAAVFSGLRNTPGTMKETVDHYLDEHHYADLTYFASLGFSQKDIDSIKKTKGIAEMEYGYQVDAQYEYEDAKQQVTVYSSKEYNKSMINAPDLISGRYPHASGEAIADQNLAKKGCALGDTITLKNDNATEKVKIVGIINDVRYVSKIDRGTSTLGDGTNQGFIEVLNQTAKDLSIPKTLKKMRKTDVLYNSISIRVSGAESLNVFLDAYDDQIEVTNTRIKSTLSERISTLYDHLTGDAQKKLKKAKTSYDKALSSYNESYSDYQSQINNAKIKLTNAKIKLASEKKKYYESMLKLNSAHDDYAKQVKQMSSVISALQTSLNEYVKAQASGDIATQSTQIGAIDYQLGTISKFLDGTSTLLENENQLELAKIKLDQAEYKINLQEYKLNLTDISSQKKFADAKKKLSDAKSKIVEAQAKIDDIPKGTLYTFTHDENVGLAVYEANTDSISSIANVFPLIFFLVAALVSLTTMTRMVEEQRGLCGTLRALGYSKKDIIMQYVYYAFMATFFSCLLGMLCGNQLFPRVIVYLYTYMMFNFRSATVLAQSIDIALMTVLISVVVTMAATLSVCLQELSLMPAVLMRPKAPRAGKRILLERMTFIWRKLSFNQKVTMRNIFRYKKRFLMSIIGIAGCTALIITGFGIKHSVSEVVYLQYHKVFKYDGLIRLEKNYASSDGQDLKDKLLSLEGVTNVELLQNKTIDMINNDEDLSSTLMVYQSADNIKNFISFSQYDTHKSINLDDKGVVISQKAAELMNVDVGDTIDLEINDMKYNVKISAICENYYVHYCYISKTLYESLTGATFKANNACVNLKNNKASTQATLTDYLKKKQLGSVEYLSKLGNDFNERLNSINIVIVILTVCAAALCFIVLYNLTNINIEERKGEIATIKVLGFRRREYYDYIFRENIILSIIGGILGLLFGTVLHRFIISTVELDATIFVRTITWDTYLYAFLMTIGFTILINRSMRHILRNVNMVESLKSIE